MIFAVLGLRSTALLPLHLVVKWPVFTIYTYYMQSLATWDLAPNMFGASSELEAEIWPVKEFCPLVCKNVSVSEPLSELLTSCSHKSRESCFG